MTESPAEAPRHDVQEESSCQPNQVLGRSAASHFRRVNLGQEPGGSSNLAAGVSEVRSTVAGPVQLDGLARCGGNGHR